MITAICITDQVYILKDRAGCCSNLVLGEEQALVFDTGTGVDDLYKAVRKITDLPLLVINSHGHFDHIGGNCQFETVYLAEADFKVLERYDTAALNRWRREMVKEEIAEISEEPSKWSCMHRLDFETFDLGNLYCRMIPLPGHTQGSVGVLIPSLRILLSGDALTPVMCLNFENHLSRKEQYETLEMVCQLTFDRYLTSHHDYLFQKSILVRMLDCIKESGRGPFYKYTYPYPPYAKGWMHVGSTKDEPVAVIISDEEKKGAGNGFRTSEKTNEKKMACPSVKLSD